MPPASPRAPVDAIRQAARLAVESTSLRAVARSVGVSPMGLKNFLDGRKPYSATSRKLNAWYVTHEAERRSFPVSAARGALAVLLDGVPQGERGKAGAGVLDDLGSFHLGLGTSPPAWLAELRDGSLEDE